MRKRSGYGWIAVALVAAIIAGGCGVHVGNGMRKLESEHGFQLSYSEKLNFRQSEDGRFVRIDNGNLVGDPDTVPVSYMEVRAEPGAMVRTIDDLRRTAERENEGLEFIVDTVAGVEGLVSRVQSQGQYSLRGYAISAVNALLRVVVEAYREGNGFDLIKPIFGTMGAFTPSAPPVLYTPRLSERVPVRARAEGDGIDNPIPVTELTRVEAGRADDEEAEREGAAEVRPLFQFTHRGTTYELDLTDASLVRENAMGERPVWRVKSKDKVMFVRFERAALEKLEDFHLRGFDERPR